jgi:hypothetical protein
MCSNRSAIALRILGDPLSALKRKRRPKAALSLVADLPFADQP